MKGELIRWIPEVNVIDPGSSKETDSNTDPNESNADSLPDRPTKILMTLKSDQQLDGNIDFAPEYYIFGCFNEEYDTTKYGKLSAFAENLDEGGYFKPQIQKSSDSSSESHSDTSEMRAIPMVGIFSRTQEILWPVNNCHRF